eukprot:600941-Prymnesium_polylepis.2
MIGVYQNLTTRAAGLGLHVSKVVFRGYMAPQRLQKMHDDAIERRTKLVLERVRPARARARLAQRRRRSMRPFGRRATHPPLSTPAEQRAPVLAACARRRASCRSRSSRTIGWPRRRSARR